MAFNFPPGPNYTETETKIFFAADILELAANSLLACPISTINFILILKTSILHPNLKLILLCQSLCIFIRGIGRIILNIARLYIGDCGTYGPTVLLNLYMQPIFFRNCIMHVMIIERIIATFKSKNYEKHRSNLFHFSWLAITAIIGYLNSLSSSFSIIGFLILFTLVFLGILEIWALFWILNHNKTKYEKKLLEGRHELSERYQLSENIRTAKQLIPCILMHFLCIIIPGLNNIIVYFKLYSGKFTLDFVTQCIFTAITLGSFLIECFMITFHPFLKRDLVRKFYSFRPIHCRIFASIRVVQDPINIEQDIITATRGRRKTVGALEPLDIYGKPLISYGKKDDLGKAYFKQLAISWE